MVVTHAIKNEKLGSDYQQIFRDLESAREEARSLEEDLERARGENTALTATGIFYRSLTDIVHKCLTFGAGGGEVGYLMKDICMRVPTLIPSEATISFALVADSNDSSDLIWHHVEEGTFESIHFPKGT